MKLRQFDLVVFDWDGTLFDSTALITRCIQESCADLGLPIPSDRDASYVIGLGLRDALTHAVPTLAPERYGDLALRYRTHYLARQHDLMLFDGALELLDELKQRCQSSISAAAWRSTGSGRAAGPALKLKTRVMRGGSGRQGVVRLSRPP